METVQVYFQSPYTDYDKANGIEKAAAELCGFAKTDVLAPGASEDVTITVKKSECAPTTQTTPRPTFWMPVTTIFTAATDSHNAVNILAAKGYTVAGTNGRMTEDGDAPSGLEVDQRGTRYHHPMQPAPTALPSPTCSMSPTPTRAAMLPGSVTWMSPLRLDRHGSTQPAALTANETLGCRSGLYPVRRHRGRQRRDAHSGCQERPDPRFHDRQGLRRSPVGDPAGSADLR